MIAYIISFATHYVIGSVIANMLKKLGASSIFLVQSPMAWHTHTETQLQRSRSTSISTISIHILYQSIGRSSNSSNLFEPYIRFHIPIPTKTSGVLKKKTQSLKCFCLFVCSADSSMGNQRWHQSLCPFGGWPCWSSSCM